MSLASVGPEGAPSAETQACFTYSDSYEMGVGWDDQTAWLLIRSQFDCGIYNEASAICCDSHPQVDPRSARIYASGYDGDGNRGQGSIDVDMFHWQGEE